MTKPRVFLSYCRDDQERAARLFGDLTSAGIDVWWDQDVPPGSDWKFEIRQAMTRCNAVVLCVSARSAKRTISGIYPEALDAIGMFRERRPGDVFLIPVRFSKCDIPPIEIDATRTLDRLEYVDLFPASQRSTNFQRLVRSIRKAARSKPTNRRSAAGGVAIRSRAIAGGRGKRTIAKRGSTGRRRSLPRSTALIRRPIHPPAAVNEILQLCGNTSPVIENSLRRYLQVLEGLQQRQLELHTLHIQEAFSKWLLDGDEAKLRQRLSDEIGQQTGMVREIEEKIAKTQQQRRSVEATIVQEALYKTIVSVDMAGYSDVARLLEENQDPSVVMRLNKKIQEFVDGGLSAVGIPRERAVIQTTGDGALLVFERARDAHRFAEAVHAGTVSWNRSRKEPTAKRWFRIGAASGPVSIIPDDGEVKFAGITIANAVRLETAARPGELVVDIATYDALPGQIQRRYGKEENVHGKRNEIFLVRRCDMSEGLAAEVAETPIPVPKPALGDRRKIYALYSRLLTLEAVETLMNLVDMPAGVRPSDRLPTDRRFDELFRWASHNGHLPQLESELLYLIERQKR